jgi:hypothetical protein
LVLRPLFGLLYQPQMTDDNDDDDDDGKCGAVSGMQIGKGNLSTRKKTCPSATLSTTNPT